MNMIKIIEIQKMTKKCIFSKYRKNEYFKKHLIFSKSQNRPFFNTP